MRYDSLYWDDIENVLRCIPNLKELYQKSILVTGATGMICSAVTDLLLYLNKEHKAGINIILAGRNADRTKKRFDGFVLERDYHFTYYDAISSSAPITEYGDIDYIICGAGNAHPAAYATQPVETILANSIGLNAMLQTAVRQNVKSLLYISSSEVYGNKSEDRPYKENDYGFVDILNPRACYPCSKRLAETLCAAYGKEYGIGTVIVRPGHIYGPTMTASDSRAASQFIRNALDGEPIVMKSAGTQQRSYCYVMDCASAILTALLSGAPGTAYNISNPQSLATIREFAEAAAEAADVEIRFENPSDMEKSGYNLMDNSTLDSEKLEQLGWRGCFDLMTGIRHTLSILNS